MNYNFLTRSKSSEELWKDEKTDRLWIYFFLSFLAVVSGLALTIALIWTFDVINTYNVNFKINEEGAKTIRDTKIFLSVMPFYLMSLGSVVNIGFTLFGWHKSFQKKTYRFLSVGGSKLYSTGFVLLSVAIYLGCSSEDINYFGANQPKLIKHTGQVYWILALILVLLVFSGLFFVVNKYVRVQQKFRFAYVQEKNAEMMQKNNIQPSDINSFMSGFMNQVQNNSNNQNNNPNTTQNQPTQQESVKEENDGLDDLSTKQLMEVAKQMFISGADLMTRKEVLEIIRKQKNDK